MAIKTVHTPNTELCTMISNTQGDRCLLNMGNCGHLSFSAGFLCTHFMNYVPVGGHEDTDPTGAIKTEHFLKFMNHSASRVKPSKG